MGLFSRRRSKWETEHEPEDEPEGEPEDEPADEPEDEPEDEQPASGEDREEADESDDEISEASGMRPRYGIDKVVELLQSLPVGKDRKLIAQVVKKTLESTDIRVSAIIVDAENTEAAIAKEIDKLSEEVASFQKEIASRRKSITELETKRSAVSRAKAVLALSEDEGKSAAGDESEDSDKTDDDSSEAAE